MSEVTLTVNGKRYSGWKTARISRSIETIAGGFVLSVSERWANQDERWPIAEEDQCVIQIGNTTVITGFIDKRELSFSALEHSVEVTGKDRAGALVECSAMLDKWEFKHVDLKSFAEKLCRPFGIAVSVQPGLVLPPASEKLSINPGDTAFDALEHACRLVGVLPVSDGDGGVVLTRSGTSRCSTALVQGQNILSASASFEAGGKFRTYHVLGQHHGSDETSGARAAAVKGSAADDTVKRAERVLLVRPEHSVTIKQAKDRAEFEAATRAARSNTVSVVVQGWTQSDGTLWPLNSLVQVKAPMIDVDGEMLITAIDFSLGDNGTTTTLTLRGPKAFTPAPTVTRKSNDLWKEIAGGV